MFIALTRSGRLSRQQQDVLAANEAARPLQDHRLLHQGGQESGTQPRFDSLWSMTRPQDLYPL